MKDYFCSIEIEVTADSAEAAAKQAWELISGPVLPVIDVMAKDREVRRIDLQALREAGLDSDLDEPLPPPQCQVGDQPCDSCQ